MPPSTASAMPVVAPAAAGEVEDGVGHLLGGDQPTGGLASLERSSFGRGIGGPRAIGRSMVCRSCPG